MVYGVAYAPLSRDKQLRSLGFADSKKLSEEQREKLLKDMKAHCEFMGFAVRILTPAEISCGMMQADRISLNEMSFRAAINLIKRALAQGVNIHEVRLCACVLYYYYYFKKTCKETNSHQTKWRVLDLCRYSGRPGQVQGAAAARVPDAVDCGRVQSRRYVSDRLCGIHCGQGVGGCVSTNNDQMNSNVLLTVALGDARPHLRALATCREGRDQHQHGQRLSGRPDHKELACE
jgi:hypothetical protein